MSRYNGIEYRDVYTTKSAIDSGCITVIVEDEEYKKMDELSHVLAHYENRKELLRIQQMKVIDVSDGCKLLVLTVQDKSDYTYSDEHKIAVMKSMINIFSYLVADSLECHACPVYMRRSCPGTAWAGTMDCMNAINEYVRTRAEESL